MRRFPIMCLKSFYDFYFKSRHFLCCKLFVFTINMSIKASLLALCISLQSRICFYLQVEKLGVGGRFFHFKCIQLGEKKEKTFSFENQEEILEIFLSDRRGSIFCEDLMSWAFSKHHMPNSVPLETFNVFFFIYFSSKKKSLLVPKEKELN